MDADKKSNYLLSCDWGTTSFRLNLVSCRTGEVLEAIASSRGIKAIKQSQSAHPFQRYLASQIAAMDKQISRDLASVPVVISGMASSSIGWKELPYATIPFSLEQPKVPVVHIPPTEALSHDVLLISGIRSSDDVMRGEETPVLGLAEQRELKDAICILPGTHSKHLFIDKKVLGGFKTFMTGELFELLSTQSILSNSVRSSAVGIHEDAFRKGAEQARHFNLLNALFRIRAGDLLHNTDHERNYDFLSGLLIGLELKELRQYNGKKIYLVAEEPLRHRYIMALETYNIKVRPVKNTSELTAKGHRFLLNYFNRNHRKA